MERRRLTVDLHALVAPTLERRGVLAAFPEREGGVSRSPFDTLNLGLHTGDRPQDVRSNRRLATAALGMRGFAAAKQVHGSRIATVHGSTNGELGEADALVTRMPWTPVAVLVADCVPVVIASERESMLTVVHAGWRGIAGGLVGKAAMLFSEPRHAAAAIGPAIGPCHYQVGREVVEAVDRGAGTPGVVRREGPRTFLDLPSTVESVLRSVGIGDIDRAEECTACDDARFFSHRRDGPTGRHAMVAMRM
ncbi:MAG: peptidoglycan editing factor PgeF [Actinomycetota bacterium]